MNKDIIYPTMVIRNQAEAIELLEKENQQLQQKVNQLETNIDEAIEYVNKYFEKEYKKPREELKKYNLKNCTYDSGLVVLGILERGKE